MRVVWISIHLRFLYVYFDGSGINCIGADANISVGHCRCAGYTQMPLIMPWSRPTIIEQCPYARAAEKGR